MSSKLEYYDRNTVKSEENKYNSVKKNRDCEFNEHKYHRTSQKFIKYVGVQHFWKVIPIKYGQAIEKLKSYSRILKSSKLSKEIANDIDDFNQFIKNTDFFFQNRNCS